MEHRDAGPRRAGLRMARLHHSGRDPIRVLLIGDRSALHLPTPHGTPAERAAARIWLSTRRGVDVDVLCDLAPALRAVRGVFTEWRLWRYDVVVVVLPDSLGEAPGLQPRALARMTGLLDEMQRQVAEATEILVLAGPGAESRRLQAVVDGADSARLLLVEPDGPLDERVRRWAASCGTAVASAAARVPGPRRTAASLRDRPDDEASRQRALDELRIIGRQRDPRLDDLVELARTAFGTDSAEINFIDRDQQWKMAVAGADRTPNSRAHSFCNLTIQRSTPTVIADTQHDPVLSLSPMSHGPDAVRFYAAHPIESADGYRIGSFCIYDREPRDVGGLNLAVLRDLALLAQAEIVGDARVAGASVGAR